jgi:hypothetical protein
MANLGERPIPPNHPFARPQITFGQAQPRFAHTLGVAATISVSWGYELHELTLKPKQWAKVMAGEGLSVDGPGYGYEGEWFQDYWTFDSGLDGDLVVSYGDDGGTGWIGKLSSASITEHPPRSKTK